MLDKLAAPFNPDVVSWRVGSTTADKSRGMALAYIDSRDVQDRLNEVCGPFGWQCRHEVSGDKRVTCHIGIKSPEGEWCWKSDGAGETDFEGEKGSYSDSFKRAAVKWGIGRYLYDVSSPWVAIEKKGNSYAIVDSEKAKLRAVLTGSRAPEPVKASASAPKAPDPSATFKGLQNSLRQIEDEGHLKLWVAEAKEAVDRKLITVSEHAMLQGLYKARAAFVASAPA